MRSAFIGTIIDKSIARTSLILFKPFSLKKWFFLLTIAIFSGAIGGGGNGGGSGGGFDQEKAEAAQINSSMFPVT